MNEKARTIVFNISALLLLAGAGLYRVAVYIRLRPDVQRTERMDDLPDHFSPASVIHGICHP